VVIVDISLIYKWFIDEEPRKITDSSRLLLKSFLKGKEKILCPNLILYELGNILAYKNTLSKTDIDNIWQKFSNINLPLINPTGEFMKRCIDFSLQYHVTVYDASYAILALEKKCILLTADSKFAKKINFPFVKLLTHYPLSIKFKESLVKNKGFYKRVGKDWGN
jgi:predicted nucleic acid-binding protein